MQKPDCDDNIERPATINECPTSKKSLFDYFFDCNRAAWIAYDWIVPQYIHNANLKFNEIFVPTADFVRISQMLNQLNNVCILEVNRIQDESRKKKKKEKQQERIDLFVESKCWDAFLCTSFSTNIFFHHPCFCAGILFVVSDESSVAAGWWYWNSKNSEHAKLFEKFKCRSKRKMFYSHKWLFSLCLCVLIFVCCAFTLSFSRSLALSMSVSVCILIPIRCTARGLKLLLIHLNALWCDGRCEFRSVF